MGVDTTFEAKTYSDREARRITVDWKADYDA